MLRYGGDCAGLPRFYYFLDCEYAAAGGDSRVATRRIWAAHGAVRSGVAGGVSGWARGAVVGEAREGRGGVQEEFRAGCGTVCEGGRAVEEAGALFAAVLHGASAGSGYALAAGVERFVAGGKTISRDYECGDCATGGLSDREPGRVSGQELRDGNDEDHVSGEQCVRETWRALPAGDGDWIVVSFAERRRAGDAGILRARDGRDGSDHAGAGGFGEEVGWGDRAEGGGGADGFAQGRTAGR